MGTVQETAPRFGGYNQVVKMYCHHLCMQHCAVLFKNGICVLCNFNAMGCLKAAVVPRLRAMLLVVVQHFLMVRQQLHNTM